MKENKKRKKSNRKSRAAKPLLIVTCISAVALTGLAVAGLMDVSKKAPEVVYIDELSDANEWFGLSDEERAAKRIAEWDIYDSDMSKVKVGDTVSFGRYEQDGRSENCEEVLQWDVLAVEDNAALLITHDVIMQLPYHQELSYITWKDSSLRAVLNSHFLADTFNNNEREKIKLVTNSNPDSYDYFSDQFNQFSTEYGAPGGEESEESVFVLSYEEAIKYYSMTRDEDQLDYVSDAVKAEANPIIDMANDSYTTWWLRSPGDNLHYAMYISEDSISSVSGFVDDGTIGVRPCIWVNF